jgi:hypothetical protein
MEIEGAEIWREVRERIVRIGPLKVLKKMVAAGINVEGTFSNLIEDDDAAQLLNLFGEALPAEDDPMDAGVELLQRIADEPGQLRGERRRQAEALVLRLLDRWAEEGDNPGTVPAGRIIGALSSEIARWEFDSGYPGSAQVIHALRFGGRIAAVSEYGVFGLYGSVRDMLGHWLHSGANPKHISGPAVSAGLMTRLENERERNAQVENSRVDTVAPRYQPLSRAEIEESARNDVREGEAREREGDLRAAALDFSAAVMAWRQAATLNCATAHWKLAVLFSRGRHVEKDPLEAARRCLSAGELGDPRAQLRLARAAERLLKYRQSDFWQKQAAAGGLTCSRLERDKRNRLSGSRHTVIQAALEMLAERFGAGRQRSAIDLVALSALSGQTEEARRWLAAARENRLRVEDFLVLEMSGALALFAASPTSPN